MSDEQRQISSAFALRAMLQPRLPRRSYLGAGLGDLAVADFHQLGRVGGSLQSRGELPFRRGWIEEQLAESRALYRRKCVAMLAALSYFFVIGPVQEIVWEGDSAGGA